MSMVLELSADWSGQALAQPHGRIELRREGQSLWLRGEARCFDDPLPSLPPGRCPGLWNFEVLELFLLGDDARYLELEFGPGGHWLALAFAGERACVDEQIEIAPTIEVDPDRACWRVACELPDQLLPPGLARVNAYAIHGQGAARRHLAWRGGPGAPDFHRLAGFDALDPTLRNP